MFKPGYLQPQPFLPQTFQPHFNPYHTSVQSVACDDDGWHIHILPCRDWSLGNFHPGISPPDFNPISGILEHPKKVLAKIPLQLE